MPAGATPVGCPDDCVLMPGVVDAHVHVNDTEVMRETREAKPDAPHAPEPQCCSGWVYFVVSFAVFVCIISRTIFLFLFLTFFLSQSHRARRPQCAAPQLGGLRECHAGCGGEWWVD